MDNHYNKYKYKYKYKYKGGEVIDSGGQGCVFKPALRCMNQNTRSNGISKLGLSSSIEKEWNTLENILKYIKNIPNYKKYFLLNDMHICKPDKLTFVDKEKFNTCTTFNNIDTNNINDEIYKFGIINMPYGGISLENAIFKNITQIKSISRLLSQLLIKAIIPMNKLGLYHSDLKANNILYNNGEIKIIDYGLLIMYNSNNFNIDIYNKFLNKHIQFNSPLSRVILSEYFVLFLQRALMNIKIYNLSQNNLLTLYQKLIRQYYYIFKEKMPEGHYLLLSKYIIPDIYKFTHSNNIQLQDIVCDYCAKILLKYLDTNTKIFHIKRYISDVYIKNVDVYGLIMSFLPYISNYNYSTIKINITHIEKQNIALLFHKYCFSDKYADIPINIENLFYDINNITRQREKTKKTKRTRQRQKTKRTRQRQKTKRIRQRTKN